ncbi:MAG: hypothetical protein JWM11_5082, partial [Planctomycetaceae bacterium]|nr:hypothetical protein [Planctomycetaceae bacterium]
DHIITVYQVGEEAGIPFLAMEFLEGESLDDRLKRQSPLPPADALWIGREIAEALAAAHAKGLLHRDVKPANVWLETNSKLEQEQSSVVQRVKLLDFGLARSVEEDVRLTSTGMILGTPSYMAPEQAGNELVDARADLFALGVILYRMTTGRLPFPGARPMEVLKSLLTLTPAAPQSLNPDIPKELSELIERLMAKEAKDRPESAVQVIRQLAQIEHTLRRMDTPVSPMVSERSEIQIRADQRGRIASAAEETGTGRSTHRPWRVALAGLGATALFIMVIVTIATRNVNLKEVAAKSTGEIDSVTAAIAIEDATNQSSVAVSKRPLFFQTPAFDQWMKGAAAMSAEQQVEAVRKKLMELNPEFNGKVTGFRTGIPENREKPVILDGVVTSIGFDTEHVTDISPVRALTGLQDLDCGSSTWQKGKLCDLSPLQSMKLTSLFCADTQISDLSPLKGMSLIYLNCGSSKVVDLSPLRGMPLDTLGLGDTNVSDLSPIKECPLTFLNCDSTMVTDISLLNRMILKSLYLNNMVTDLSPLKEMPLQHLYFNFNPRHDPELFRSIKTLETVNAKPADVFCKEADAYRLAAKKPLAFQTPEFDQWMKDVASLTAERQVDAVSQKLQELNPRFNGKAKSTVENGLVIELRFPADNVTDISPVRAFRDLRVLECSHIPYTKREVGGLSDLSPLNGMSLTALNINHTHVADLSPLSGMKLTWLGCQNTNVADLSPLKGMPLTQIELSFTLVRDLSPLRGMPLSKLWATKLNVNDFSPLQDTSLTFISLELISERDSKFLRSMPTLEAINDKPVAEFWRDVNPKELAAKSTEKIDSATTGGGIKGATNKSSVEEWKRPLFFRTPAFDEWMKDVTEMPAEKQVEAVRKKLVDLNPEFDGKVTGHRAAIPEHRKAPTIFDGAIASLGFDTEHVTDISPVRALSGLQALDCGSSTGQKGKLDDLSPLQGMKLTSLYCADTQISDLSPLTGMSLIFLNCGSSKVVDLSPLRGMPLDTLGLCGTNVSDLSPIKECPLTDLNCDTTFVADIPLLNRRTLKFLYLNNMVTDLLPLKEMPLQHLYLDFNPRHDPELFRSIKTLETINGKPLDVFCKAAEAYRLAAKKPMAFRTPEFSQWMQDVGTLTAEKQVDAVSQKLQELNPGFNGKTKSTIENGLVIELRFLADNVTDISPVRAFNGLRDLECSRIPYTKREVGGLSDLLPLNGMSLTTLNINHTFVADLSPLSGMKLTWLGCHNTYVADLSPLQGMPLAQIDLRFTLVRDLSPLKGMRLAELGTFGTNVRDFSPLQGMPLSVLSLSFVSERDTKFLRSITNLKTINNKPAAEFWMDVNPKGPAAKSAGEIDSITTAIGIEDATNKSTIAKSKRPLFFQTPAFDPWMKGVAAMSADNQIEAVRKKLMDLNPEFDGKVMGVRNSSPEVQKAPQILDGVVIHLGFATDHVTDISPVRALSGLQSLDCGGSDYQKGKLFDLSPLQGMKLLSLFCPDTQISDLSPLKGMSLSFLNCNTSKVVDLSPLNGMPLGTLGIGSTNVSNLSEIGEAPLLWLNCDNTLVTDVSSLNGMLLTDLFLNNMVADLSPLKKMALQHLRLNFNPHHEPEHLSSIKTLKTINGQPADVFCKAAEAYRLAATKPLAFRTPGFDQWMKEVGTLTAEKQVVVVSQKLQELNPGFNGKATPIIEAGLVVGLEFLTDNVTDVSPVRAFNGLKFLNCSRSDFPKREVGGLSDISPLNGMQLTQLNIRFTHVADLSPLRRMKLTLLDCHHTNVADLSSLQGMPVTWIDLRSTLVRDLSPLQGMRLAELGAFKTNVRDFSPLQDMPLTALSLSFDSERDTKFLRPITTLKTINDKPASEFWKDVEGRTE